MFLNASDAIHRTHSGFNLHVFLNPAARPQLIPPAEAVQGVPAALVLPVDINP